MRSRSIVVLSLLLAACCDCEAPPDAGSGDAGRDAGADGGTDAGADAGRDAGEAGDGGPTDPGWVRLTQVPDPVACRIDVARYPNRVRPLPRFRPCGDGCRELVVDWEPNDRGARLFSGEDGYHDGTHAYFFYGRPYVPAPGQRGAHVFVARDDGVHLLALRLVWGTGCTLAKIAMTDTTFATAVIISDGTLRQSHPIRARFDDPIEQWATPEAPRPRIDDFVVTTRTTNSTTVYEAGISDRTHRYDAAGAIEEVGLGRNLTSAVVSGETVFLSAEAIGGWRVGVVPPGETDVQDLVAPSEGSAWVPDTDGVDLVWEQTYRGATGSFERVELWAAPHATDPSELAPRRLTVFPTPNHSTHGVGFGRAWAFERVTDDAWGIAIYALDGSERRVWELPADRGFYNDAIVGPEEIGFFIDFTNSDEGTEALRFYRYDALPLAPPEGAP